MQWDNGPNAGFSTAHKKRLYLPLDPRRNSPTVERQASDPGSLLNHVRNLIALRKRSPALQADGNLIPLPVENNDRHFTYLRQAAGERFLIVLNPSTEPSSVRINGIKSGNLSPQICHGAQAYVEEDDIQIKLAGISYGVFEL